jgi:single-stranded-DNA-specific exonuclease
MSVGIACLLAPDERDAEPLARELDRLNRERREVEATMQSQALDGLDATIAPEQYTLCVYRPEWHQGVVGIVASRLKDRFHRPTIVFARASDGTLRGSGRAISGFHLRDALDLVAKRAPGTIDRFGGHAFAAGLTLAEAALPRFSAEFERVARDWLSPAALLRTLETDGDLADAELTLGLARDIGAQVWGQGFPAPLFDGEFGVLEQTVVGGKHLRLTISGSGTRLNAIVFNETGVLPVRIRAAYRPEVNHFQDLESLQIVIESWQPV